MAEHAIKELKPPHGLSYLVWKESMQIRYFIEVVVYMLQVFALTYFISVFNKEMHTFEVDIEELYEMRNNVTELSIPDDYVVLNQTQYELGVNIEYCVN